MNSSDCAIDKSEIRVRQHWLLSTLCLLVICPIVLYALMTVIFYQQMHIADVLFELGIQIFAGVITTLVIWHCAYRKYGSKLLNCWLVVRSLSMVASIGDSLRTSDSIWTLVFLAIEIAFFMWWFILSIQIKIVNEAIQKRLSLKSNELKL